MQCRWLPPHWRQAHTALQGWFTSCFEEHPLRQVVSVGVCRMGCCCAGLSGLAFDRRPYRGLLRNFLWQPIILQMHYEYFMCLIFSFVVSGRAVTFAWHCRRQHQRRRRQKQVSFSLVPVSFRWGESISDAVKFWIKKNLCQQWWVWKEMYGIAQHEVLIWDWFGVDLGLVLGRLGVDSGSIWVWFGIGSGQPLSPTSGSGGQQPPS